MRNSISSRLETSRYDKKTHFLVRIFHVGITCAVKIQNPNKIVNKTQHQRFTRSCALISQQLMRHVRTREPILPFRVGSSLRLRSGERPRWCVRESHYFAILCLGRCDVRLLPVGREFLSSKLTEWKVASRARRTNHFCSAKKMGKRRCRRT